MSHQFGFGWAKSDPNDLCLREERNAGKFNHLKSVVSNAGAFVLPFIVDSKYASSLESISCYHFDGDFEQVSIQVASRFLLKYPDCTAFPSGGFPELYSDAKPSILPLVKSKLILSLKAKPVEDDYNDSNQRLYHAVMFSAFDCLLKQGYHAFASDDQLRGVVARLVDNNMMEVCLLRNCVINHSGKTSYLLITVSNRKVKLYSH